jgi:hypothetical protein
MDKREATVARMALKKLWGMREVLKKKIRKPSRMKGRKMRIGAAMRAMRPAMPRPRKTAKMLDWT